MAGKVIGAVRIGSATCPVAAVEARLSATESAAGLVFRRTVNQHGRIAATLLDDRHRPY
jgi:hypothetical protein